MIFREPMTSLNPALLVEQIAELSARTVGLSGDEALLKPNGCWSWYVTGVAVHTGAIRISSLAGCVSG